MPQTPEPRWVQGKQKSPVYPELAEGGFLKISNIQSTIQNALTQQKNLLHKHKEKSFGKGGWIDP